jgi:uncharacterized membrane protein YbhN (UPF0104 family)
MNPKTRQVLLNLARIVISVTLLGWIISRAGLDQLLAAARTADPRPYGVAILLTFVGIILRAWRWKILLNAVGARVPFWRAVYLYFVGAFFNAFLPTGFGGDVVRVLEIGEGATSAQAAGTAVVDRLTGFIALFLLALLVLPFGANLLPPATTLFIAAFAGAVVLGSLLLFEGRSLRWLTAHFPRTISLAGDAWLGRTYGVITACGPRAIAGALAVSTLFNLQLVFSAFLLTQALRLNVSILTLFLFVPVATAALLAPISISGLGVREGIFVTLLGQVGVSAPQAVVFSLAYYSLDLSSGLLGGVIYFVAGLLGLKPKTRAAINPGQASRE